VYVCVLLFVSIFVSNIIFKLKIDRILVLLTVLIDEVFNLWWFEVLVEILF